MRSRKDISIMIALTLTAVVLAPKVGLAAETGMPWEGPLDKILSSITGPVAKALGVIAIVIAGFGIAFGEGSSGTKRLFQVVFGLSIAFTASSFILALFGVSHGLVLPQGALLP